MFGTYPRRALLGAFLLASLTLASSGAQAMPEGQMTPTPLASGCGASPGGTMMLDPSTSGTTTRSPYSAVTGVPFSLTLPSNRTTGYSWVLAEPLDDTVLQLDHHVYNRPSTSVPGAGGTETWTFTPLCAGATTVSLVYRRPWEPATPNDRREVYDVAVQ